MVFANLPTPGPATVPALTQSTKGSQSSKSNTNDGLPRHGDAISILLRNSKLLNPIVRPPGEGPDFDANQIKCQLNGLRSGILLPLQMVQPEAWKAFARQNPVPKSPKPKDWLPSCDSFIAALKAATGASGGDGWSSAEARIIATKLLWIAKELHSLWMFTARYLHQTRRCSERLARAIFCWRVAGIPKKTPDES